MYCYIFPSKMYGYILASGLSDFGASAITSSGRTYCWITSSGRTYRSLRKRFSVSVIVQTETVFRFLRGRQRTAETVFSFRRCTDGNGFQFLASLAENGGNGFQFPNNCSLENVLLHFPSMSYCPMFGILRCPPPPQTDDYEGFNQRFERWRPSKCTGIFWNHK